MSPRTTRVLLLAALLAAGCNDDDPARAPHSATLGPGTLILTANGGSTAGSATGNGGGGGSITGICRGNVFVGVNPAPQPPPLPATPTTGTTVKSWSNTLTIAAGNAIANGDITIGSSGSTATLNVNGGDLVINGSLTTVGGINLYLNAMSGTVYLHGSIRTGRVDGTTNGSAGGNVTINALRIIFTGSIDTRGENNPSGNGGFGGSVNLVTDNPWGSAMGQTSQILIGGSIDMAGGDAAGEGAVGGAGGNFKSSKDLNPDGSAHISGAADGAVYISGTSFNQNGGSGKGSGDVSGGSAGYAYWMADGGFVFDGMMQGIGGSATSSDGEAAGGSGTAIFWNEFTIGDSGSIAVFGSLNLSGGSASGPTKAVGGESGFLYLINGTDMNFGAGSITMRGGDSSARGGAGGVISIVIPSMGDLYFDSAVDVSGGNGQTLANSATAGSITLRTDLGDLQVSGSMTLNGGNGSGGAVTGGPSGGGRVTLRAGSGDFTDGGSIVLRGSITANGGSDSGGSDDNNGGYGGIVDIECDNPWGSISLDPESSIRLDGGAPNGPATHVGGAGGTVTLKTSGGSASANTVGGNIALRGSIAVRGGPGGGSGGLVFALSDAASAGGGDGRAGDITLYSGATIDASGGEGGGNAQNDGPAGASEPAAVTFDADGNDSDSPTANGVVLNLGSIVARGGAPDGNGGDVRFDGLDSKFKPGPASGSLDLLGFASGLNGGFKGE